MASGDDIEAGRTTHAESTTTVLAGRPSELDVSFNGTVAFLAGSRADVQRPDKPVCGVLGVGWNGFIGNIPTQGGCGVLGFGAANQGTGVIGLGGGARHRGPFVTWAPEDGPWGSGGVGVFGRGGDGEPTGDASTPFVFNPSPPAPGVFGRGGASRFQAPGGADHAAGVVGIAGGLDEKAMPSQAIMANAGVVGQGGNGGETSEGVALGSVSAGCGVRGIGGVRFGPDQKVQNGGPGVVGIAGTAAAPPDGDLADMGVVGWSERGSGVYGRSKIRPGVTGGSDEAAGVVGASTLGVGVSGISRKGNGGYFVSRRVAQVHLDPLRDPIPNPNGIVPGRPGDMLVTRSSEGLNDAELWFCRRGDGKSASATSWVRVA